MGPTYHCAIHRCGTSHWNTPLSILIKPATWWSNLKHPALSYLPHINYKPINFDLFSDEKYKGTHAVANLTLKEKKTHGFSSCIVINICPLQILSMKKAWEYRGN